VHLGDGIEQEGAEAENAEAAHHCGPVTETAHEQSRRHGEEKITAVERRLYETGLQIGEYECFLELRDQDVVEAVGDAPCEEQTDDQNECQKKFLFRALRTLPGYTSPLAPLWGGVCFV
jgi:hypothetical protein